jgi:F-type H+-transporting ATPase subunit b
LRVSSLQPHFSIRLSQFFLLAIFALGVAAAPFRLAAQQQPATESAPSASAVPAQPAEPVKVDSDEEAQTKAFRLEGPLVKATSRALHISLENTARLFEIVNFAIIALAIAIPLFKLLPAMLRKRTKTLTESLESARKMTEDANARLSAVEAKLASLEEQIAQFRAEVERESAGDEARIKAALEEERARIVQSAEQEIGQAAALARRGLRNFAVDLAIDQASREINMTAETDRALIREFAAGAEFVSGAATGGKN